MPFWRIWLGDVACIVGVGHPEIQTRHGALFESEQAKLVSQAADRVVAKRLFSSNQLPIHPSTDAQGCISPNP